MEKIEKRNCILSWNEEAENISMPYINDDGFLKKTQPLNEHAKDN
jgi:hypothetical protein